MTETVCSPDKFSLPGPALESCREGRRRLGPCLAVSKQAAQSNTHNTAINFSPRQTARVEVLISSLPETKDKHLNYDGHKILSNERVAGRSISRTWDMN